jgi:hypothetical protein
MTSEHVDLDPALAADLTGTERLAAQVHVLRARADAIRGPRRGERSLLLAMRASSLEEEVLAELGVEDGARVMAEMADHAATRAAIERWLYALRLTERVMQPRGEGPDEARQVIPEQPG